MAAPVPAVEVADHRHALRVRRPHREARAGDAFDDRRVAAELVAEFVMASFADQVQVELAEQRAERIRVVDLLDRRAAVGVRPRDAQAIRGSRAVAGRLRDAAFEQSGVVDAVQRAERSRGAVARGRVDDLDRRVPTAATRERRRRRRPGADRGRENGSPCRAMISASIVDGLSVVMRGQRLDRVGRPADRPRRAASQSALSGARVAALVVAS